MLLPWRFHETLLKDLRYMLYKSLKNCQFSFTPCRDRSRDSSLGKLKAWIFFQKLANKILVSLPKTICIQFADILHEKSCNMGVETPVIPVFCKFQIFCLCIHNFYFSHSWCFRCFYYIIRQNTWMASIGYRKNQFQLLVYLFFLWNDFKTQK